MAQLAEKVDFRSEHWKSEIGKLVADSTDREEAISLKCFERAMQPLLSEPGKLRTLLGKIQAMDSNN